MNHLEDLVWQVVAFLIIAVAFSSFELLFRAIKTKPLWRKDSLTDFFYWLINPMVSKPVATFAVTGIASVFLLAQGQKFHELNTHGFGPIIQQPLWLIVIEMVILSDLLLYWRHRLMHMFLWRLHSIHHSSRQVDWLSSVRFHPIDQVLQALTILVPLYCLGFPLTAIGIYMPFITLFNYLVHSNVDWTFGPLKYIIVGPVFHRWHHTLEEQGQNKNFCTLFPFFDYIFGTFYLPPNTVPRDFGIGADKVPDSFLEQLVYPWKKHNVSTDVKVAD